MSDTRKVMCSVCSGKTEHKILFDNFVTESQQTLDGGQHSQISVWSGHNYTLYQCCGCKNVVMQKAFDSSEIDHEFYDRDYYVTWHPPIQIRKIPKWHRQLPEKEADLLKEIYISVNSSCNTVACMGMRAVLDMYIVRKVSDKGNFQKKLKEMVKLGFLSAKQEQLISPVLEVGNAASHRGYTPDTKAVLFTLDVIENLLQQDVMAENIPSGVTNAPKRN